MSFLESIDNEKVAAFSSFLDREVAPVVDDHESRAAGAPTSLVRELAEFSLISGPSTNPSPQPVNDATWLTMIATLSGVWPSLRNAITVTSLVHSLVDNEGTAEQRATVLPQLGSGRSLAFFALTEPTGGSDAADLRTSATYCRESDGWVLEGTKKYIGNGSTADFGVAFVSSNRDGSDSGPTAFLIDRRRDRYEAHDLQTMGMRSSSISEIKFSETWVPDSARLGNVGAAFRMAKDVLMIGRCVVAFACLGVAEAACSASVAYARERVQFGRAIGSFQLVQQRIAECLTLVETSRLLAHRAADVMREDNGESRRLASMAKRYVTESALQVCDHAIEIHGGAGYTSEYQMERLYRDIRHLTIAEGTNDIQSMLIAGSVLGVSALRG